MKQIYTITAIAHKDGKGKIFTGQTEMTINVARAKFHEVSARLRKAGYEDAKILLLKNGKLAFPKLNQDLKNITNSATGKTLWQEVQNQ